MEEAFASREMDGWLRTIKGGQRVPIESWKGAAHTNYLRWKDWHPQEYVENMRAIQAASRASQPDTRNPAAF